MELLRFGLFMNRILIALLLTSSYIGAQQNTGPVTVRRTDHTLVWPLDFFTVNGISGGTGSDILIKTNSVLFNPRYLIKTNSVLMFNTSSVVFRVNGL